MAVEIRKEMSHSNLSHPTDISGNNDNGNDIGRDDGWWFNGGDKSCPASSN
ncbi:hypothetical protein YC2023_076113 [Brassica napus]